MTDGGGKKPAPRPVSGRAAVTQAVLTWAGGRWPGGRWPGCWPG